MVKREKSPNRKLISKWLIGGIILQNKKFPSRKLIESVNGWGSFYIVYILPSPADSAISDIGGIVMNLIYLPSPTDSAIFNIGEIVMTQSILTNHSSSSTQSSHKPVNNTDTPSTRHGETSEACVSRSSSKFIGISRTAPHFVHRRCA